MYVTQIINIIKHCLYIKFRKTNLSCGPFSGVCGGLESSELLYAFGGSLGNGGSVAMSSSSLNEGTGGNGGILLFSESHLGGGSGGESSLSSQFCL